MRFFRPSCPTCGGWAPCKDFGASIYTCLKCGTSLTPDLMRRALNRTVTVDKPEGISCRS